MENMMPWPTQNLTPKTIRQGIQHYTVGKDQTTPSRKPLGNQQQTSHDNHLHGTPKGREKEEGQETPGRDTENERKKMGYTGKEMEKIATNRQEWRTMANGPSEQTGHSKQEKAVLFEPFFILYYM